LGALGSMLFLGSLVNRITWLMIRSISSMRAKPSTVLERLAST
jgi:hypothetical protein